MEVTGPPNPGRNPKDEVHIQKPADQPQVTDPAERKYRDKWPKPMFFCTGCDEQTDSDPCDRCHTEALVLHWEVVLATTLQASRRQAEEAEKALAELEAAVSDQLGTMNFYFGPGARVLVSGESRAAYARIVKARNEARSLADKLSQPKEGSQ